MSALSVTAIAHACHEANRVLQAQTGEQVNPPWHLLDVETQASATDGVRNAQAGATQRESHENWLRNKVEHGWVYGPVKDFDLKQHPCIVPYDDLPPEQQIKDRLFTAIVAALSGP